MSWSHGAGEYAPELEALAARGVRVGMLSEAPQLTARARLAVTVWGDLAGERQIGMSCGPIPWRAIVAWCDRYRVKDWEIVTELVQAIDTAWLYEHSAPENSKRPDGSPRQLPRGTAADDREGLRGAARSGAGLGS